VQERLKALQAQWEPSLALQRAPQDSAHAPFPLMLRFDVDVPASCSHFDLDSIAVITTIEHRFLSASASDSDAVPPESCADAASAALLPHVRMHMESPSLPYPLRAAMAAHLCIGHRGDPAAPRATALVATLSNVYARATTQLPELLTLVPEALERYDGVDARGSTERRTAFVLSEGKSGSGADVQDGVASASQAARSMGPVQALPAESQHSNPELQGSTVTPLCGLAAELARLQRRFPALECTCGSNGNRRGVSCTFRLELTPSDPAWQGGSVSLSGTAQECEAVAASGASTAPAHSQIADATGVGTGRTAQVPVATGAGADVTLQVDANETVEADAAALVSKLLARNARAVSGAPTSTASPCMVMRCATDGSGRQ
jgi:hypothetical protein